MASSIVATLSDALHSLQSPNLSRTLARRKHNQAYLDFDLDLSHGLSRLHRPERDYLTLPWLHDAMSLVLLTYSAVLGSARPNLSSAKERRMLEVHLEDSIKLLDACNALKGAISDAHHYVMLVRYAARLADVKDMDDGKLVKVKDAFSKCVEFLDARGGGIKVDGCGSLVCRMGDQNPKSAIARNSTSNVYFSEIHAAKVTSVFVLRELAAAFSLRPSKFPLDLHLVEDTAWASSLSKLQQNVKDVADLRKTNSTIVPLEELDNLHSGVKGLLCIILEQETCSTDTVNWSIPIQRIMKAAGDMQQGLTMLQHQIDVLFRNLVAIRGGFLDALCYCKS